MRRGFWVVLILFFVWENSYAQDEETSVSEKARLDVEKFVQTVPEKEREVSGYIEKITSEGVGLEDEELWKILDFLERAERCFYRDVSYDYERLDSESKKKTLFSSTRAYIRFCTLLFAGIDPQHDFSTMPFIKVIPNPSLGKKGSGNLFYFAGMDPQRDYRPNRTGGL